MGFLERLRKGAGTAGPSFAVFDEFFHPAGQRAREELEHQNQLSVPTPSPGDRMLEDGVFVVRIPTDPDR